jgi:hypothetical protein
MNGGGREETIRDELQRHRQANRTDPPQHHHQHLPRELNATAPPRRKRRPTGFTLHLGVQLRVQAQECVLIPLCNNHPGHGNDSGTTKRLLRGVVPTQDRKRPQDLIPNGMHPLGLLPGSGATSVSAGHGPVLWAWLDLNQRPHPYQRWTAKRRANEHSPRRYGSVSAIGMG